MKDSATTIGAVPLDGVIESHLPEVVVVHKPLGECLSYLTRDGVFEGSPAQSIAVIEDDSDYQDLINRDDTEVLALPTDKHLRREILAKWAKKAAKKNKAGLIPVMLLPLAACNTSTSTSTTEVTQSYNITEDAASPGTWVVTPADAGAITITQAGGNYKFTPTTGDAIDVAVAGVNDFSLSAGTYTADVAALANVANAAGTEPVSGAGNVALTKLEDDLDADLSVITTTGTKTVAISGAQGVKSFTGDLGSGFTTSIGAGSTLSTTATILDGQTISGAGTVVVSGDLSNDLGVDLSAVTATGGITATETAGGTFTAGSDLGAATVTINAAGETVDLQAAGAGGVDASTFIVNAGTLVVTHAQMDAISNVGTITGSAGNVTVIAGSDTATGVSALLGDGNTQSSTALVKVDMSGTGTLTFDLPSDDNDTLVLEAGSVIKFGAGGGAGGTVVVDHGEVDARNVDAANWTNVGTVRVNSGINITAKQLEKVLTGVETSGSGRINVEIEEEADIALVKTLMTDTTGKFKGATKPAVTLEASSDATDATALENKIIAEAPAIAKVAKIAIPVKTMAGGIKYSSPSLDIRASSDSGVSDADNVSQAVKPLMKIILPNANLALENDDTITVKVETLDGTTFTEVSSTAVVLNNTDGDVNKNVEVDANGNSYIYFSGFDASQLDPAVTNETFYITALADDKSDNTVNDLPSNKVMYVLDTTAPSVGIKFENDQADVSLGGGQTSKVTVTFSEKVVGFDPAADITLSDSSAGSLSAFTSADGGKTWISEFTPAAGLASGSTTISLTNESYTDVAGNLGAGITSGTITVDTKAPDVPTVAAVSTDNLLNKAEHDGGFTLTGTCEAKAGATVKVSGFLTGAKDAVVDNGAWTLAVAKADLGADAATMLSITQSDAVGNKSDAVTLKLTTDVTAPTAVLSSVADNVGSVTGALSDGQTTDDTAVIITGTNEAGSTVDVYNGTTKLGAATVSGTNWTYEAALSDGTSYALNAIETDSVGNPSSPTSNFTVIGDTTAPTISVVTTSWGSVLNSIEDNSDGTVTIATSGAEDGQTVTVVLNSKSYTGTVSSNTTSITVSAADLQALSESSTYTLSANVSDAAGNAATQHSSTTFSVDKTAPTAVLSSVADNVGSVTGALSDGQTTDDTAVIITGTNEAGSTVDVYNGTTKLGAATVSGTNWTYEAALSDGTSYALNAIETDSVGNPSSPTSNFTVIGDTTAPTISDVTTSWGSVLNSIEDNSDGTVTIATSGAEDGQTVTVVLNSKSYTGTVSSNTTSITVSAADLQALSESSTYTLSANVSDAAGNAATQHSSTTFSVDKTAPTAVLSSVADNVGSVTGALSDGQTTDDTAVIITGTNEAGSTVDVYNGTTKLGAATVSGTNWTYEAALSDGTSYALNAIETDSVGNPSSPTSNFTVIGDTTAPTISVVTTSWGSVLNSIEDNSDGTVTIATSGAEDGQTVTVVLNSKNYTGTVSSNTTSITVSAADLQALSESSTYTLSANVSDAAGNAATQHSSTTFSVDKTAPTAVLSSVADNVGSVTGALSDGQTTDDTAVIITGTNEAGSTVDVYNGTTKLGAATVSGTNWTYEAALSDGTSYALNAIETDSVGNPSSPTSNFTVIGDTTAPTISVVTTSWGSVLNSIEDNSDGTVTIATSGAEDGQTVTVVLNSKSYTGTVSSNTTSITVSAADLQALSESSTYTLSANVSDAAGNAATQHSSTTFSVDKTAPTISGVTTSWGSVLNSIEDNSDGTVTIATSGAEDGQTVTVVLNSKSYTGTVSSNTTSITVSAADLQALSESSTYTLSANVSDAAGNAATQHSSTTFSVDKTAPGKPANAVSVAAASDGIISASEKSSGVSVSIDLTNTSAATGDTVELLINGASFTSPVTYVLQSTDVENGSVIIRIDGQDGWGNDGTKELSARVIDVAGNVGVASDALSVVLEASPPNILTVTSGTTDGTYNIGDVVAVNVKFDEVVTVTGTPQLTLETGDVDRAVDYVSGSGSDTLLFNYTVQSGDVSGDLAYGGVSALALNSGTILDNATNAAILTLPAVGGTGSLSNSSALVIDGVRPAFTGGAVTAGTKTLVLNLGEAVSGTPDAGDFAVTVNSASNAVTAVAVASNGLSITLTLTNFVQNNNDVTAAYTANSDAGKLLKDAAGNTVSSNSSISVTRSNDTNSPDVLTVTSSTTDGTYNIGDVVAVNVKFDEVVTVTGTPQLTLETGDVDRAVDYVSGSGSDTLLFNYTVQSGDVSGDLAYGGVSALALNSGTILDNASNAATLTLPAVGGTGSLSNSSALVIDGVRPAFTGGAVTAGTKTLVLNLGEAVSGTPDAGDFAVTVNSASNAVTAVAVASNGLSITLTLTNFVQNNNDVTAAYTANSDAGKLLKDAAGNTVSSNSSISVTRSNDTNSPDVLTVTSSTTDGTYNIGDVVAVNVKFDEVVTVTGTPQLTLETGDVDRAVDYVSGSGSDTLLFNYTVQSGDVSGDLAYGGVSALALNSGTILDNASNAATLTLPAVGGTGSLSNSSALVIDGVRPAFTGGAVTAGTKTLVLSLGEAVSGTPDAGDFAVTVNSASNAVTAVAVASNGLSITLTLTNFVQNNNDVTAAYTANSDAGKLLKDAAGNTVSSNSSISVTRSNDTNSPDVLTVTSSTTDGTYNIGDVVAVNVKFDEVVTVTGTPQLTLETGDVDRVVDYVSGSGSDTLLFNYTVQSGDVSGDLAYGGVSALALNSGTILDNASNAATLTLPAVGGTGSLSNSSALVIDGVRPAISGVTTSWGSVLNSIEDNSDGTVTIATSGAEDGQTVTVVLNSKSYTGTVSSNTTSITVSAADLQALSESSTYTLSANVSDAAGNAATQHSSTTFSVDKTAPTISGVTTSWGSVLNSIEDNSDGTVTIATSGAEDGQTVTVVLNSKSYTGTVSSNTTSITVSAADLQALSESSTYTLSANVSDAAGNAATQHSSTTFSVDKTAPTAVLSSVADNVGSVTGALSDGQTTDDTAVIITGTNEAGSTVDVYNGTTKLGAATVSGTNWTYEAALSDGTSYALNAIETDSVGNPSSPTSNFTVIGDTTAPTISVVTTSWGSVLNSIEDNSDGTVTIATSGAEDGQTVTVVLNSKSYTGTVSSNTTSITVSAADLQALSESSTYTLSANVSDAAGNAATQHSSTTFSVDKTAPTISGVTTSWGSVLNSIEDNSDGTVTIATSGAEDGQTVTVVLNSKSYTGTVSSNTTSITVSAADLQALSESSTYTLSANVSDAAGNAATQHSSTTFSVDKTAPGKPANAVSVAAASDGIISASEKSSGVSVSIDLTNTSAATGDTVELLINGASFTSPVTYVLQSTDVENGSVSITINSSSGWGNDGTKELSARVIDVAGNVGVASDALSVVLEASPPNILTVTSGTTDGTYNIGDVVAVNVKFDEVVTVTGTPQLTLETGDVDRAVDYVSGSGSDTLLFNYTVQSGDVSGDLAYGGVSALALNSGTILDNGTNAAILTLPTVGGTGSLSNSSALVIDGVRPAFTGGAVTAGTKTLVLNLGEAVSGTPDAGDFAVTVNSASNAVTAVAVASNGLSITLTLTNFVQNNNDVTAAYTANSDAGKLLKDAAGNTVSSNSSISVTRSNDTNSPDVLTVTSSTTDGTYNIGDVVAVNVKFDEVVTVTGTPQLTLETGDVDRAVDYVSGSGSDTLLFNYTVQSGDVSGDLAYGGVSALALNSGTILDNASNAATLTLPAVGGTGSLSNSSALVIDGVRPAFTGGAVTAGTKTLVLSLGEAVSGTPDAGDFAVTVNSASNAVTAVAVASNGLSITLTLTNFVQNNNDVTAAYTANSDAGKLLKDAAGNTVSSNSSISVTRSNDTNSPDVLTVTSSTTDGTYNIGDVVAVNVKFDEVVTVTGTPQLTLETGDVDRAVDYVSGSGSDTLLFNYTVQSGDVSGDLAYGGVSALALNSGTILDNASNAATLTLPAVGGTGSLSNSSALVIDGVRPAFTGGAVTAGTKTLVLSLGEAVSGTPDAGDFAVTVNSASNAVTAVAVASNGLSITLTLTNFVQNNNDVTAAYTANSDAGKLLKDAAGNTVSSNSSISVTRSNDTNSPDVLTVTSSTTDGTYNIGDVVAVNVKFDEVVTVTGTPQLTLETGDVDRAVDYVSGSGSDTLLFNYTVQSGDVSGDLAYGGVSALALNSGTILDNASNAATLTLPAVGGTGSLSNSSALVIDGVRPAFTGGAVTAGTKTLVLSLGEAVSGTPDAGDFAVTVNSASNAVTAVAVASNGLSITLTLTNFVQNNNDVTAAYTANSDAGKLLKDAAGNTVSSNSSISVTRSNDTNSPDVLTVTSSTTDGTYNIGDVVAVNVKFDEVVTVTGTPQLTLETGDVDRAVDYVSGSGSDTLLFNYTVQSGDVSGDLAYGGVSALALNSGTILDNASNAATLTLPAVGGTGSLSNSSALVIDGVRPAFTGGAVTAGTKTLVLSLGEAVSGTPDAGDFAVTVNSASNAVTAVAVASNGLSITLTLTNFVQNNNDVTAAYTANSDAGKLLKDAAGNTVSSNSSISVTRSNDTNSPDVLTVTSSTTDGTYNIGDVVAVNVKFDEVVTVTGTPQLTLETGDVDRVVDYVSGSGSDTLLFNYTVQSGDVSGDLAYGGVSALALNSGTILDNASNAATLTLPAVGGTGSLSNSSALVIDGVRPAFTGGAVTAGTKTLVLSLGEAVSGTPDAGDFAVTVNSASNAVTAVAVASNGLSITLTLTNFVQNDSNVTASYTANSDTSKLLTDAAGNTVSSNSSITVVRSNDDVRPTVLTVTSSTTDGSYDADDLISIALEMSEVVTVTGTPQLTLETGDVDRAVDYVSGSGSDTLLFNYTVQSGDASGDLDYTSSSALSFNDGIIEDIAGNILILTLPEPGTSGSLSDSSQLQIIG